MNKEIEKAIEIIEHYVECKRQEIKKLSSLIAEAKEGHPIIDKGYFRITKYTGGSKYIQAGKVYKGRTLFCDYSQTIVGRINNPRVYFSERNASWEVASKEEYINQRKTIV